MVINVLKPGFYTTIQDFGRFGFQHYGVPVSGVMDRYSAKLANTILNNAQEDAVLEIAMTGPTLLFEKATIICIAGADMSPKLNEKPIKLNTAIPVNQGDVVSFGKLNYGFRTYLSVLGGFQSEEVMGSRSQYHGITSHYRIIKNEVLQISNQMIIKRLSSGIKISRSHFTDTTIQVYKGPEFDRLTESQKEQLFSQEFMISKNNNRMAYQLEEVLANQIKPIITSLVLPGTVQLTPSGKLIVLMRDCQTTGGYPRILQLSELAINILSQKFTGCKIQFQLV